MQVLTTTAKCLSDNLSVDSSTIILNLLFCIKITNSSKSVLAIALLIIEVHLVLPQEIFLAMSESGQTFFMSFTKWSDVSIEILCSAIKSASRISPSLTLISEDFDLKKTFNQWHRWFYWSAVS